MHDPTDAKWKVVMLKLMKIDLGMLNKKFDYSTINKILTFYSQILKAWQQTACYIPNTQQEIVRIYFVQQQYQNRKQDTRQKIHKSNKLKDTGYINRQ